MDTPRDSTTHSATTARRGSAPGMLALALLALAVAVGDEGCAATVQVDACNPDPTVDCATSCTPGDVGYTCTGVDVTPPDSAGYCTPVDDVTFCCFTTAPTCMLDSSITGCSGTSTGWSCTGSDAPDAPDTTLECSVGVPDPTSSGTTDYCCLTGETFPAGTCAANPTVAGCAGGSYGFTCAGSDTPGQTDSTLICDFGVPDGSSTDYCCLPPQATFNSCAPDSALASTCTTAGSFGFKCTSTADDPTAVIPTLTCSAPTPDPDGTSQDFCCTN